MTSPIIEALFVLTCAAGCVGSITQNMQTSPGGGFQNRSVDPSVMKISSPVVYRGDATLNCSVQPCGEHIAVAAEGYQISFL